MKLGSFKSISRSKITCEGTTEEEPERRKPLLSGPAKFNVVKGTVVS